MASQVPRDPNLSPEMRRFLDGLARVSNIFDALTATQSTALLNVFTSTLNGLVPLSGGGTTKYLRADATWATVTAPIFTVSYTSAQQTITAAGSLTLAHSLGAAPLLVQARLVCQTAEFGYSIADEVIVNPHIQGPDSAAAARGVSIVPDATNLNIRFGSAANTFEVVNKTSGASATITNANWKLVLRAWA